MRDDKRRREEDKEESERKDRLEREIKVCLDKSLDMHLKNMFNNFTSK